MNSTQFLKLNKQVTYTQRTADELNAAHLQLLQERNMTQEDWFLLVLDHGTLYAEQFARMFPGMQKEVRDVLLTTAPDDGCKYNWYWMWFKHEFMQDDAVWVDNLKYNHMLHYESFHLLSMRNDDKREMSLLTLLNEKYFKTKTAA